MPGGCPGRQEVCSHRVRDRLKKILNRYVQQRLLDICVGDEVERDIDGAGLLNHRIDILVNHLLVEGIDHVSVRSAAMRADLVGDLVERSQDATGEENPGSLVSKGTGQDTAQRRLDDAWDQRSVRSPKAHCALHEQQASVNRRHLLPQYSMREQQKLLGSCSPAAHRPDHK